jgi:holo-[acyl-carrier protein] synthase
MSTIYGIGTDLVKIERIAAALQRSQSRQNRFVQRVLGPLERTQYQVRDAVSVTRGVAYLATRFAAKEAFAKAIRSGLHAPMSWHAVQVVNQPGGAPQIVISSDALAHWMDERGLSAQISLSDERDYALAFVIVTAH